MFTLKILFASIPTLSRKWSFRYLLFTIVFSLHASLFSRGLKKIRSQFFFLESNGWKLFNEAFLVNSGNTRPSVQFQKRKNHPWGSVIFSACNFTRGNTFSRFLKCNNGRKSRKISYVTTKFVCHLASFHLPRT